MTTLPLSFQFLHCQLLYIVREMLSINHQYKILFNSVLIFVICFFVLIWDFAFSSFSSSFRYKDKLFIWEWFFKSPHYDLLVFSNHLFSLLLNTISLFSFPIPSFFLLFSLLLSPPSMYLSLVLQKLFSCLLGAATAFIISDIVWRRFKNYISRLKLFPKLQFDDV